MADIPFSAISNIVKNEEWVNAMRIDAMAEAFWGDQFRGAPGSGAVIVMHAPSGSSAGVGVLVPLMGNLEGDGQDGDATNLDGNEETLDNDHQHVVPESWAHAVRLTSKTIWASAVDLVNYVKGALVKWAGRRRDREIWSKIMATTARLFAGDAVSRATLGADDTFGTAELARIALHLQRMGAEPLQVEVDAKGRKVRYFGVVISALDASNLKTDAAWSLSQTKIGEAIKTSALASGAEGEWMGLIIYVHNELAGSGSPLRPEVLVRTEAAADAVTIAVGGAKAGVNYTRWFPTAGTLLIGTETITYTGKTANTFTGCTRGGGGGAAIHAVGSLVTLNNVTFQVGFGAEAIACAPVKDATPLLDEKDYGRKKGFGVELVEGYEVAVDIAGNPRSLIVMESYAASPAA